MPMCQVAGTAERKVAVDRVGVLSGTYHVTPGADKNYDTQVCTDDPCCANVATQVT